MTRLYSFITHKFFKVLLALYLAIFLFIWLLSSPIAKYFINPLLAKQQLHLSDEASIRFNPFLMRLTLSDIEIMSTKSKPEKRVFSLAKMELQVELWQLALDKVVISKFLLEQGTLKVIQYSDQITIAGLTIPLSPQSPSSPTSPTKLVKESTDEPVNDFAYQLVLPHLLLSQFDIEVETNTEQKNNNHHITIEKLALNQVTATQTKQQAHLVLNALIDKSPLVFSADTQLILGKGDINSKIHLTDYPIEKIAFYLDKPTTFNGSLAVNSQQKLTLTEQGINFNIQQANFTLQDLLVGLEHEDITLSKLQYKLNDVTVALQNNLLTHLAGQSSIELTNAALHHRESEAKIVAFKQLSLADVRFVLDEEPSIDIANVVLDELLLSKKANLAAAVAKKKTAQINKLSAKAGLDIAANEIVSLPPVMQLKQLLINNIHVHEKSIVINSIIFDTLTGNIIVKENKEIANLVALGDEVNEETITQATITEEIIAIEEELQLQKAEATLNAYLFSFNELRFINENSFDFTDFSVAPIYQRTLFLDTFTLGALSNRKEKQQFKTPFTLAGRSNKYAKFTLSGYLQPFAERATYHVKGDFKEFSLPALSSYFKASTGIEVKTGQLNTDFDLTLIDEEIQGNIIVLLQALETGLVDSEEAGSLIDQGALPLNMAMNMLKDSDGNVELDVPLSGSLADPNFGLGSIITLITKKAIMSATQNYLLTTFVPYANIVSIAIVAGEFALKLRFDDLVYQVEQIEPDDQQSAYLNDFIALMQEKQKTRITLCAISVPADIGLIAGVPVTEQADIKRLIDLGEQREHAFKEYLIEEGEIDSSRILFCKPQIDSDKDAIPRIAISV